MFVNHIKNSTKKVAIASAISFIIAISIFLFFMNYANPVIINENKFFNQEFPDKKKIYLLGSSYVGQIDANIINDNIHFFNDDYLVYNLAIHSDSPTKRIGTIDEIIKTKPDIVMYGIPLSHLGESKLKSHSSFEIQQYFEKIFSMNEFMDIRQTPRDITLDFVLSLIMYSDISERDQFNPFYPQNIPVMSKIDTNMELEEIMKSIQTSNIDNIPNYDINKDAIALESIFQKLKHAEIEIIVFTTPYSRVYLEHTNPKVIDEFFSLLNTLTSKYDIKVYDLQNKYADLEIWSGVSHVAYNNENSTIYSEDIGKIILKEIGN